MKTAGCEHGYRSGFGEVGRCRQWRSARAGGNALKTGMRRLGLLAVALPSMCLMGVSTPVLAQTHARMQEALSAADQPALSARVEQVLADPALKRRALLGGRDRAFVCAYCHGKDGNSVKRIVPSLAGQLPGYLVDQLIAYTSGTREDFIMQGMMRDFSADDVVNITAFYSSQALKPLQPTGKGDVANGQRLFLERCQACHGPAGAGMQRYPRIAGQSSEYTLRALQRYKDPQGKRSDPTMSALAAALSDAQMADLASWLESAH